MGLGIEAGEAASTESSSTAFTQQGGKARVHFKVMSLTEEVTEEVFVLMDFEGQPNAESLLAKASTPGASFTMIEDKLVLGCPSKEGSGTAPVQIQCTAVDTVGTDMFAFVSADRIHIIGTALQRLQADQVARID